MLKIYLDWNCINNIDRRHPELFSLIQQYREHFVFPYSEAHLRDLMAGERGEYFYKDLLMLEFICRTHFLETYKDGTTIREISPSKYIELYGDGIKNVQDFMSSTLGAYQELKKYSRESIDSDSFKRIQGAPTPQFLIKELNKQTTETSFIEAINQISDNVAVIAPHEVRMKTAYHALELFGYRPEKPYKSFCNVDADATHAFYASHCDYLVTSDGGMADKTKALCCIGGRATKVVTPGELVGVIKEVIEKEFSIDYVFECIEQYGVGKEHNNELHFKRFPIPLFGFFDACLYKEDKSFGTCTLTQAYLCNSAYFCSAEVEQFYKYIDDSLLPIEELKALSQQNDIVLCEDIFSSIKIPAMIITYCI